MGGEGMTSEDYARMRRNEETDLMSLLLQVGQELNSAAKWPGFHSAHEGFAVLKEEVDELWDHVKVNQVKRDLVAMRGEAIQIAAMAVKFVQMLDAGRGRR